MAYEIHVPGIKYAPGFFEQLICDVRVAFHSFCRFNLCIFYQSCDDESHADNGKKGFIEIECDAMAFHVKTQKEIEAPIREKIQTTLTAFNKANNLKFNYKIGGVNYCFPKYNTVAVRTEQGKFHLKEKISYP